MYSTKSGYLLEIVTRNYLKQIELRPFIGVLIAGILCVLPGCSRLEEYNSEQFEAGGAICLSGKRLEFIDGPIAEKNAPYGHAFRYVTERSTLPVDPAGHTAIDFSNTAPFELTLPDGVHVAYYFDFFERIYIGSDGTIAFGSPGTGNSDLINYFGSAQLSLLPVDATVEGAMVRYAVLEDKIVVTYENVGGNTFQCELFIEPQYQIAFTYLSVTENTRKGVVGIPDLHHGAMLGTEGIEDFLESRYTDSNLCEDSPLNWPDDTALDQE